jgi:hypothetical protein
VDGSLTAAAAMMHAMPKPIRRRQRVRLHDGEHEMEASGSKKESAPRRAASV